MTAFAQGRAWAHVNLCFVFAGWQPFPVPREMTVEEIKTCVEQFRQGALNCIEAGFDGIEVGNCRCVLFEAQPRTRRRSGWGEKSFTESPYYINTGAAYES